MKTSIITNVHDNKKYWEHFYRRLHLSVPSQFCVMVATEIPAESCIIEFGCGNGRDSLYLGSHDHTICAMDMSDEAVKSGANEAKVAGLSKTHFLQGDLSKLGDLEKLFKTARKISPNGTIVGYSRFVMHSINDEQEADFLSHLNKLMKPGEKVYFEFRSKEDASLEKTFGGHYRRFVDTVQFIKTLTELHDYKLNYDRTGQGMAKYKTEDPFVSRLIFEKK